MSAICVADLSAGIGVSRGVFSTGLSCEGNAGLLIVNLNEVKTLAQLNMVLGALPGWSRADHYGRTGRNRPPRQSESTAQTTGPFEAHSNPQPNSKVLAFSYAAGWSTANVAASMRPYSMGSVGGPHAAALIVDHERPGSDLARSSLIGGAVAALSGTLS